MEKELEKYLNLKTKLLNRFLNRKEMDRVIYILKFLDYSKEEIRNILIFNELLLNKVSIIEYYEYYKDKIEYYKESYGFLPEADELYQYYEEVLESNEEEDKRFFEYCLKEKLNYVLKLLPKTYDYELKKEY